MHIIYHIISYQTLFSISYIKNKIKDTHDIKDMLKRPIRFEVSMPLTEKRIKTENMVSKHTYHFRHIHTHSHPKESIIFKK